MLQNLQKYHRRAIIIRDGDSGTTTIGLTDNADFERLQEHVDHLVRQYENRDAAEYDANGRLHVLNELHAVAAITSDVEAPNTPASSVNEDKANEEKEDL